MARNTKEPIRQYRGTTAQHEAYVGPLGEVTIDTTKTTAVVQDGVTYGGHPVALEERRIGTTDDAIVLRVGEEVKASVNLEKDFTIGLDIEGLASELVDEIVKDMVAEKLEGSLVDEDDQILGTSDDGKISATACLSYEQGTGKLALTGKGEEEICSVTIPSATSMLESIELVKEDGDGNEGYYLKCVFVLDDGSTNTIYIDLSDLFNPVSGGDGITVSDDGVISADIQEDGGLVFVEGQLAVDPTKFGCAMLYEATEETPGSLNQILCVDDQLYAASDYGTMDPD